jgi:hypothetical protein
MNVMLSANSTKVLNASTVRRSVASPRRGLSVSPPFTLRRSKYCSTPLARCMPAHAITTPSTPPPLAMTATAAAVKPRLLAIDAALRRS